MVWPGAAKTETATKTETVKVPVKPTAQIKPIVQAKPAVKPAGGLEWLDDTLETILIYGKPKCGKTHSACSYIDATLKTGGKVYVVTTDKGFVRTAHYYFGADIKDRFKDNVFYKEVHDINEVIVYYKSILPKLTNKDLLMFDLLSDFWDWAQIQFVEDIAGGDIQKYIQNASKDKKSFGLFENSRWGYVKALHKFVDNMITKKPCNIIGICTEKDTDAEKAIGGYKAEKRLKDTGFGDISTRPGGQKEIPYKFETMIRIGLIGEDYVCQIIGDRGHRVKDVVIKYGKNLKSAVDEFRSKN